MVTAERYHDFSAGHRVVGHEGKCRFLHGHNYRVHFTCVSKIGLDTIGRVIDFGQIKERLCMWLEENWDHRMLLWDQDTEFSAIKEMDSSVVELPFNPTAENMAQYLVEVIAPKALAGTGIVLLSCRIEETRKCSCVYVRESI